MEQIEAKQTSTEISNNEGRDIIDEKYSNIRLQNIRLHKDSTTVKNNYVLEWFSEPISKIYSFRIKSGIENKTVLEKVNKSLKEHQLNNISNFYECSNNERKRGEYNYTIDGIFITNNFLSIECSIYYDCGGVHPNEDNDNLTVNLRTGKVIKYFDEIFPLAGQSKRAYSESKNSKLSESYDNYLISLGNKIIKIISILHSKEINDSSSYCQYYTPDKWYYASFTFRYDGLYLNPSFPHVSMSCAYPEFSLIPYKYLIKYLNKDSKFVFDKIK